MLTVLTYIAQIAYGHDSNLMAFSVVTGEIVEAPDRPTLRRFIQQVIDPTTIGEWTLLVVSDSSIEVIPAPSEYDAPMTDDELRTHLVTDHDVTAELANRLSHSGLIVIHVGSHESAGTQYHKEG